MRTEGANGGFHESHPAPSPRPTRETPAPQKAHRGPTWDQLSRIGSLVVVVAGATWVLSMQLGSVRERLSALEERTSAIVERLDRSER